MREVGHAEAEGVSFAWLSSPHGFVGDDAVREVTVQRMELAPADAQGRQPVVARAGDFTSLPADMVIKALGYDAEDLPVLWGEPDLAISRHGTLAVDAQFMTSLSGVYAAGDIVRGASLVVWAIRDGRDAAAAMHAQLMRASERVA